MIRTLLTILAALFLSTAAHAADRPAVKVGVVSILSGDLRVLGQNVLDSVETYRRHHLRHKLEFVYEDAKLSSSDGLRAYQKLINIDQVDMIIGACSSNGTMASKTLINTTRTPTVTIVTGGENIDQAGPYIFRIGNSDRLNGIQEAEAFRAQDITRVALLTEETEYTQDIAKAFVPRFKELGGTITYGQDFLPGTTDFRSAITAIKKSDPKGILMPTQTGTALGVFVKQWRELGGSADIPIHTSFVAAPNPDAHKTAGEAIWGVYYMAPEYDRDNPMLLEFFSRYKAEHGKDSPIPFHTAGTIDTLNLLQAYLDQHQRYDREEFAEFLLSYVKDYRGTMGTYSFDAEGNSNLGFSLRQIRKEKAGRTE